MTKGKNIAYVRVSTTDQNEARQNEALNKYNIDKWYVEKITGKDTNRPKLIEMLDFIREDDTVYVEEFSRLGRSTQDLLDIVQHIENKLFMHLINCLCIYIGFSCTCFHLNIKVQVISIISASSIVSTNIFLNFHQIVNQTKFFSIKCWIFVGKVRFYHRDSIKGRNYGINSFLLMVQFSF